MENNYTNYSNPQVQPANVEPTVTAPVTPEVEPVVTPDGPLLTPQQPVITQPDPEPVVTPEAQVKKGIVVNCDKLKVRKAPTKGSEAIAKITKGNEVIINEAESKGGFYKISTISGIEGYCMKAYIKVK